MKKIDGLERMIKGHTLPIGEMENIHMPVMKIHDLSFLSLDCPFLPHCSSSLPVVPTHEKSFFQPIRAALAD
jgi:hypothetical protein